MRYRNFNAKCYEVVEVCGEVSGNEEIFDLFAEAVSEPHDLRFLIEVKNCHIANKFQVVG